MSLWPAYWTEEKLRKKEDEVGSAAWSTEYMNEPLSSEDAIIKKIHYYEMAEIDQLLPAMKKYGGIDPATGAHDKCAFCSLGDPSTGVLYVLDSWGERLGEQGFLDRIISTYLLWRHVSISFEDVAFQGVYKDNLLEKAAKLHVWLPIRGRKTGGLSKTQRIKEMAPSIEAGFIRFRADQKELIEQLSMFTPEGPKSAYDDEADALWYAFKEAQDGKNHGVQAAATTHSVVNRMLHTMLERFKR
jgi:predicted phage terminase large subunit-like protein